MEAPAISNVEEELRLDDPWYLREQAYAMFLAIVEHFSIPTPTVVEIQAPGAENWLVELGGTWNLLTGPDGLAVFELIEPGDYPVRAARGDEVIRAFVVVTEDTTRTGLEPPTR